MHGEHNKIDGELIPGSRGKYVTIVGNGESEESCSNAYVLDWNGNAYHAGDVYVQGDGANDFAGAKKLATEESVEAVRNSIPTKVSDLTNDAGYLTEHQSLAGYATESYADNSVSAHNVNTSAHNDIRDLISGLSTRLNALADSDDTTLDQMSEIVAYIKANKGLIDSVTTSKVNTADIVDNLTTNVATKPLSAAQGVALKTLIDEFECANSNIVNGSAARSLRTTSAYDNLGTYAFGEGLNTEASGMASHAAGSATVASGDFSYAGGNFTVADRQCMTAIGKSNLGTSGDLWSLETSSFNTMVSINKTYVASSVPPTFSPTEGTFTWPNSSTKPALNCSGSYIYYTATSYVFVQSVKPNTGNTNTVQLTGIRYDIIDQRTRPGELLFVVGNGTSSNDRSNAHTLDWSGNAWFSGDVYVDSTSGTNRDEGSKKLATEDFVTAALTALGLPIPTAADAGKILRVNAEGKYELASIANAEEATF